MDEISAPQQMASSCAGALLVSLFMTPLDVVKIRLQAQDMVFERKCFLYSNGIMDHLYARVNGDPHHWHDNIATHTKEEICDCKWYNRPKYFNGTFDAFVKIAKVEGVSSLWSGVSPTLILAVPTTVIYFTSYEQMKKRLRPHLGEQWTPLTAGALARIWAVTVVSPLELMRTKMQSKKMTFGEVGDFLKHSVKREGVLSLWRGYTPTLYRDVPFSALYWLFYERFREIFHFERSKNFTSTFISGGLSGTIASAITLPMDVIKTRQQLELGEAELKSSALKPKSTLSVASEIIKSPQGFRGLFAGLTPRVLKVAPACAIMITSYEYFKQMFQERNRHKLQ